MIGGYTIDAVLDVSWGERLLLSPSALADRLLPRLRALPGAEAASVPTVTVDGARGGYRVLVDWSTYPDPPSSAEVRSAIARVAPEMADRLRSLDVRVHR